MFYNKIVKNQLIFDGLISKVVFGALYMREWVHRLSDSRVGQSQEDTDSAVSEWTQ